MARTTKGEASRERLLEAAIELFAERGVSATSVDALCRRAGTAPTALYWHFENKEGLLAAAVDRVGGAWVEAIQKSVYPVGDPLDRLDRAVSGMRAIVDDQPHLLQVILAVLVERDDRHPSTRAAVERLFTRARAAIAQGIEDALGGPVPDAERIAHVAIALIEGAALRRMAEPTHSDTGEMFRFVFRTLSILIADRAQAAGLGPGAQSSPSGI
jgi:AcrR family transcriptional regulator